MLKDDPARNVIRLVFLTFVVVFVTLQIYFEGKYTTLIHRRFYDRPLTETSFSDLRSELLGPRLSGCEDDFISQEFMSYYRAYVRHHAIQIQAFRLGGFKDFRVLYYFCKKTDSGGLGDRLKGFLGALLACFASPEGRALIMNCDGTLPLTRAWLPSSLGFDWLMPETSLFRPTLQVHSLDNPDNLKSVIYELERNHHHQIIQYFSNMISPVCINSSIWGESISNWSVNHDLKKSRSKVTGYLPCNLPFELMVLSGASSCSLNRQPKVHNRITSTIPACNVASDLNVVFRLLDFIISPTNALVTRIREIASNSYLPKNLDQYVVAIHIRTGSGDLNMTFVDPPRDEPLRAARLAARCADNVLLELSNNFGPRRNVLWFIASDSLTATTELKRIANERSEKGENLTVISTSPTIVVHIDKTIASSFSTAMIERGFLDVFAEHFLLSVAHGMVRSRSGFSETSQAWGRIPIVKKIRLGSDPSDDTCNDVSNFKWIN
jgi:hypothetical protein